MPAAPVYTVSELIAILSGLLEDSLPLIWVEGEISNFSRPASGHWYFTLKDERAQLRCVMFKRSNLHVRPAPKDGDAVRLRGRVSIYAARGELQLVAEHLEPAGEGALLQAFERLKAKLAAEGLFDEKLKRPLPAAPRGIGIVTSATGAAIRDILTTLARRYPLGVVYLYPVPVQGEAAAPAIVRALAELPMQAPVDVVILARGGGSLEDLWPFNEEAVARAIRACAVPVVTGVGHEIDFTIGDFAADLRAPTPTAAAELAAPNLAEWLRHLESLMDAIAQRAHQHLRQTGTRTNELRGRLDRLHPGRRLRDNVQRLDELSERLLQARAAGARTKGRAADNLQHRLLAANPLARIAAERRQLASHGIVLHARVRAAFQSARERAARAESLLASFSPRAVLERGYAIARRPDGEVLRDAAAVSAGEPLEVLLAHGRIESTVTRTSN